MNSHMNLSLERVTEITRNVVRDHGPGLKVLAVTSTEGGSDRVEVLLDITGCQSGPCRISLNLNRVDAEEFARVLKSKLAGAIRDHLQKDWPD